MQPSERQPAFASASGAPPPRSPGGAWKGGLLALALGVLAKGKGLLVLLKALPFGKFLLTGGSMALSVLLYAINSGFEFALGLVLMIFIHELGHGLAMRRAGVEAGWPVFIPFFGAMIAMKGRPQHPTIEADIAYAGPVAGTGAALVCAALGLWFHAPFFLALAYFGFFINLFNLTPLGFLDGGRVARVLSKKSNLVGAVIMGAFCLLHPSPILILITVMSLMAGFRRNNDDLELVTDRDRKLWAGRYFGLCAFLGLALVLTSRLTKQHF
jgi:Zn-dependent protease